jgi:hypothetical protein
MHVVFAEFFDRAPTNVVCLGVVETLDFSRNIPYTSADPRQAWPTRE